MNLQSELLTVLRSKTLIKRTLQGAALAFLLVSIFLIVVILSLNATGQWK